MAFKNKWKKGRTRTPPTKSWSQEELKMAGFVMGKGINISICPDWKHEFIYWQIDIKVGKGKTHVDPKRYSDEEVYDKVVEYYKYYYDKHNKDNK